MGDLRRVTDAVGRSLGELAATSGKGR
jgi:hypothetical protein